jgi:hypothetical protein
LLAKNCQHHTELVTLLPVGKSAFLLRGKSRPGRGSGDCATGGPRRPDRFFPKANTFSRVDPGRNGISRALYVTAVGKRVVIVRVFVNKTQKTPRREMELALSRAKSIR